MVEIVKSSDEETKVRKPDASISSVDADLDTVRRGCQGLLDRLDSGTILYKLPILKCEMLKFKRFMEKHEPL